MIVVLVVLKGLNLDKFCLVWLFNLLSASRIFCNFLWCFVHVYFKPRIWFSSLNPRRYPFRIYKHACFDFFKNSLATVNSLSVNTSFSLCIILKSILAFGYQSKMALVFSLNFLVCLYKTGLVTKNNDPDANPRWIILIAVTSSYQGLC